MLKQQQHESFEADGFVRISAFSKDDASAMEDLVWGGLDRLHGIVRDDPATWTVIHSLATELNSPNTFHLIFNGRKATGNEDRKYAQPHVRLRTFDDGFRGAGVLPGWFSNAKKCGAR